MPSFLLKALIRNHSQYVSHKVALKSLVLVVHQHQLQTLTVYGFRRWPFTEESFDWTRGHSFSYINRFELKSFEVMQFKGTIRYSFGERTLTFGIPQESKNWKKGEIMKELRAHALSTKIHL